MTSAGAIHFNLRRDAKAMRQAAATFRALAAEGGHVTVPASTLAALAKSIEDAAGGVALVAEAVAFGEELAG